MTDKELEEYMLSLLNDMMVATNELRLHNESQGLIGPFVNDEDLEGSMLTLAKEINDILYEADARHDREKGQSK